MASITSPPRLSNARVAATNSAVFAWWQEARADRDRLPWRATRDAWHVLVAETMLGQTQAERVADRFPEMLERFPTVNVCAEASSGDLIRAWSGLGYYRRATMLHRAATQIVATHGGAVPADLSALLELPGIGPYTARAVLAFAFEQPVGVVDTNVGRVLARAVVGRPLLASEAQSLADRLVPKEKSRDWNLAIMDFGAQKCRSRLPQCTSCPLRAAHLCRWKSDASARMDPSQGSAMVSAPQKSLEGSDRQLRGRLVRAACTGPIARSDLAKVLGITPDMVRTGPIVSALIGEGLLVEDAAGMLKLPDQVPD